MSFFKSKYKYLVITGVFLIALVVSFAVAQQKVSEDVFELLISS